MAKTPRAALTRLAATVSARYYTTSGATDGFYLDGRLSGRREHRAADITLDREERGFFYSVFAHLSGGGPDDAAMGIVRKSLDRISNDVHQVGRNIDAEINELAECAVSVAGRITLQHDGVRQPYFAGVIVKDSELAAVTMGGGCAYLYRNDILYPLTADDVPLEAIDHNGKPVAGLDVYCAGVAGTVRYSNIAQLQMDDCIITCNKEVMEALGQREVLRLLYDAEDQADAAGMIITAASAKLPGVPLQCMIGFVESITAADRTAKLNLGRIQPEAAAASAAAAVGAASFANRTGAPAPAEPVSQPDKRGPQEIEDNGDFQPVMPEKQKNYVQPRSENRQNAEIKFEDDDLNEEIDSSGRGRRIAFYIVIALVCLGSLYAIYNMIFANNTPTPTTTSTTVITTSASQTTTTSPSQATTATTATTAPTTAPTTTAATSTPTTTASGQVTHKVVSGDTLWGLAVKFYGSGAQTYVDLIKTANHLTSDNLQIGQILIIPPKP